MANFKSLAICICLAWCIYPRIISTSDVVLKTEDNTTAGNIRKWIKRGNCYSNGWRIFGGNWYACHEHGDQGGDCFLETFYWSTLNARMIYVNLSVNINCYPYCLEKHDLTLDIYAITDRNESTTKLPVSYAYGVHTFIVRTRINHVMKRIKLKIGANKLCGWLRDITVYYKKCDEVSDCLATFESTVAPNETTGNITVAGQCVHGAEPMLMNGPYLTCSYDGRSKIVTGCVCGDGFVQINQTCQETGPKKLNWFIPAVVMVIFTATISGGVLLMFYRKKFLSSDHTHQPTTVFGNDTFLTTGQLLLDVSFDETQHSNF